MVARPPDSGLSPRVRGSRHRLAARHVRTGSIPACAGKPGPGYGITAPQRVYPRVCGEALYHMIQPLQAPGLSPRVRGSHCSSDGGPGYGRSIPACAGKPCRGADCPAVRGVYPRVCGEACPVTAVIDPVMGLSPRVRGSRHAQPVRDDSAGSIPACAGKPSLASLISCMWRVYPRVCGEAPSR